MSALGPGEARTLDSTVVQEYAYVYNGGTLMQMVIETTVDDGAPVTESLSFSYDASGMPISVVYNGTAYFYTVNLQGDVIAILDENGNCVVEYNYDAWGNVLSVTGSMATTLGTLNPLTYRGYVYDHETQLYYLQSRYYNPEWGRFLNADAFISTGGLLGNNMFAYCGNNPVNREDPTGHAAMQMSFNPDGVPKMMGPGLWGGGSGGVAYAANAVTSFPKETVKQLCNNVGDAICSAAEACYDAYMFSYNLQQNNQMLGAQMMQDGAKSIYDFFDENENVANGVSGGRRLAVGITNIVSGAGLLFVPVPTPAEDIKGVVKITSGIINVCRGIAEIVSAFGGWV